MSETGTTRARARPQAGRRNQLGQAMGAKGAQTRQRLLDATARQLQSTPLRELRVAHIVRAAETSPATFYVYFNDVSEAVLALISQLTQSPPAMLGYFDARWPAATALETANAFVSAYVDHWEAHAPLYRLRNLAADEGDRRFGQVRVNAVAPLIYAMADRIAEGQRAGDVPAGLDPRAAAGTMLAMIERISAVRLQSGHRQVTRPKLVRVAALLAALVFGEGFDARRALQAEVAGDLLATTRETLRLARQRDEAADTPGVNLNGQEMGPKGVRTRNRLVEATEELLASRSLLDISVADIAALAGASTATFYVYFRDVPEAVLAAARRVTQSSPELVALVARPWDATERQSAAEAFVARYIAEWQAHRGLFRVRNLASDEGDTRFELVRRRAIQPLFDEIAMRVAEREAAGELPPDLDPPSATAALLAMIERLAVVPSDAPSGQATAATVTRAAGRLLAVLVGGIGAWRDP